MSTRSWLQQTFSEVSNWRQRHFIVDTHSELLEANTSNLDQLLAESSVLFKDDRTTTVGLYETNQQQFVVKRYNARNMGHAIKRALRQSRAMRCWRLSYEFQQAGLRVAPPVLMFEKRFGPLCGNAYFVNKYLQGTELLALLPRASDKQKLEIASQVENAFKKMRDYGLTHGDMKASNILWVDEQLYFVDLDAARKHRTRISWNHANKRDIKRFRKNWSGNTELLSLFESL